MEAHVVVWGTIGGKRPKADSRIPNHPLRFVKTFEMTLTAKFLDIPIAEVVLANWGGVSPDLRLLKTTVIAYFHTSWVRQKSSPRSTYSCLVLAEFSQRNATTYLVAPIYKVGNKQGWGASDIECGDRLNPPLPDYRFYSSPPTAEELRDLIAQIGFFNVGTETKVIESFGADPELTFPTVSCGDDPG